MFIQYLLERRFYILNQKYPRTAERHSGGTPGCPRGLGPDGYILAELVS